MPELRRADGFWLLGLGSRGADVLSKLGYGMLIHGGMRWERVTWVGAGCSCAAALLGGRFHRDRPPGASACDEGTALPLGETARRILRARMFWVTAVAMSATTMVKRTNELLIPLYFRDVSKGAPGLVSDGRAAELASVWPAGVAASVLVGGRIFAALPPRGQLRLLVALLAVSTVSMGLLAAMAPAVATEGELRFRMALVFLSGAGIGLAYYIPPVRRSLRSLSALPCPARPARPAPPRPAPSPRGRQV